jgi:hypothetical protein
MAYFIELKSIKETPCSIFGKFANWYGQSVKIVRSNEWVQASKNRLLSDGIHAYMVVCRSYHLRERDF